LRWRYWLFAFALLALSLPPTKGAVASAAFDCRFVLGFQALHDLIPGTVGDCLENEWHNPDNGDGLQQTAGGLMVWRKADNWTAFTNGQTTWINGPFGLQSRPNSERFSWEAQPRTIPIEVFFSRHPQSDEDFSAVFSVPRAAPDQGVASAALEYLIAGPTPAEQAAGYFSELGGMLSGPSSCGGSDFRASIEGGVATVRFCRMMSSAGVGQDARVQSQIEATLKQFPSIQRVRVLNSSGGCLFDLSGLNRCLQ
jgi:hypothetical protein